MMEREEAHKTLDFIKSQTDPELHGVVMWIFEHTIDVIYDSIDEDKKNAKKEETKMYESLKQLPLLLSLTEVQNHVGIPKSTSTKWLMNGNTEGFPAQKIGGTWKVNRLKLVDWLEKDHSNLRATKEKD